MVQTQYGSYNSHSDAAQVMMINSTVVRDSDYETKLRDLRIHSDDFPTKTKTLNDS